MKKVTNYIFDKKDVELLKLPLPICPCESCPHNRECDDMCPELNAYRKILEEYEKRDLLEVARELQRRERLKESVKELEEKIFDLNEQIVTIETKYPVLFPKELRAKAIIDETFIIGTYTPSICMDEEYPVKVVNTDKMHFIVKLENIEITFDTVNFFDYFTLV